MNIFKWCPNCGSREIKLKGEKNIECARCGFTYYHNVAAACAVILEYGNSILMTVRKNDPARGMLDLPGGFVDYNESAEEALKREVKEELNIEITKAEYIGSFPNIYTYRNIKYHTLDMIFRTKLDSVDKIRAGDDVEDFRILDPKDINISEIGLKSIQRTISCYKKIISR